MSRLRLLLCAVLLLGNTTAQSDPPPIELLTLRTSDQIVALATRGGRPLPSTPLELRWWPVGGAIATLLATTAADGLARFAFAARDLQRTPIVVARVSGSCAVTAVSVAPRFSDYQRHRAHLMVDRPIYRPGETIRGRAVVQACEPGPRLAPVVLSLAGARLDVELQMADRRTLAATLTTDLYGCGAFEFVLPADARTGEVSCRLRHGDWQHDEPLCAIAAFRRPSLHCALAVPPPPAPDAGVDIDVSAEYSAGGPAAHQRGLLRVAELTIPFQLDQAGHARVPLDAPTLAPFRSRDALPLQASMVGPDGVACVTHGELPLVVTAPAPAAVAVGDQLAVPVRGAPDDVGMVLIAHRGLVAVRSVQLDALGCGSATFQVAADWQPGVQVHAEGLRSDWRAFREWRGQPLTLAVAPPLRVDVAVQRLGSDGVATALPLGAPCAPGDDLELQFATSCAGPDGAPVARSALLSVAVVDEQVFALREDRTFDPRAALAPTLAGSAVLCESSLSAATRGLALREMFVRGWLEGWPPLAELPGRVSYGPSGATVPGAADVSVAPRRRLAATAAFAPALVTDAQGRARLRVRLPDDVTTWRITVAAIGGSAAALYRAQVVARLPVSVSAALPRFLRAGDELLGARLVHVGDAAPQRSPLPLFARDPGELPIRLEAHLGTYRDRLELALPVRSAATFAPWSVTQLLAGDAVLTPPGHAARGEPCELVVLGGAAAILAEAAEFVGTYPYGCVEQTTSRFLPHLAALRAGAAPDPERARKIHAGLRRLRQLSLGRDRGFAYWPGWREVDVGMSAYVIHALCLARDLGLDLAAHDLEPAPERGAHAALVRRAAGQAPLESVELDLLIALAHWSGPASSAAQALVRQVSGARLSAGQLARAARCLPEAAAREAARAAGESELSTYDLANLLLAWRRLATSAEVARLEAELLLRHRDGRFGTTQATAAAIVALAASGVRAGAKFEVEVVQGDLRQTLRVHDGAGLRLPTSEPVAVSATGDVRCVVLLRGRAPVPPGHAARGVHFARYLVDAETGRRLGRCVAVGQRVKLVVELADARRRSYVALDCPLPAGFEVQSAAAGWDVSDERAVFALAHTSAQVQRAELTLVAAFAGEVAWPAAVATAMYDDAWSSYTAAERLQIAGR